MPIVVLDTNVLVSASLSGYGSSASLLRALAFGQFDLAVSVAMVFEYEEVLLRMAGPATWSKDDVTAVIDFVCQVGIPFSTRPWSRPSLRDPDDEFMLALAIAAAADHLVTSNVPDFANAGRFGLVVATPGQFLGILGGTP